MDTEGLVAGNSNSEPEKMFTQEQVNNIAAGIRKETHEKAQRELAEMRSKLESLSQNNSAQSNSPTTSNAPEGFNIEDLTNQVQDSLMSRAEEMRAQQAREAQEKETMERVQSYIDKMAAGKDLFDNFEEVMSDFDPRRFPDVVLLASEMENTPQVMYELVKNPTKLGSLQALASGDERLARKELKKLSDSIAFNEQAQDQYVAPKPPLSAPKPSQVGKDSGYSVGAFKNASWARG